ncbi:heptaprenyl diphosphate synthase component 1 [Halalkalibacter krulwichiae]|uniref:Heptaprenyl diphosphate synthase component 1 n=1 Tax=Halalkalibacter krulwichiae TaxID=199441 RepID=A0A1X9MFK9_9BACI|nr:heptaprenyl diphosphate synthase component 1 [Halalkalibacter krulwichiae]ARK30301.1 Heptaprenyl diphosphate synthase component 1 [Halalkalibacter krulwichiae]
MVSMSQFNDKVKEIKKSFYGLTEHRFLQKYVHEPHLDEDKVRFLYAMMQKRISTNEAKMFTISALLLQAALDMHDEVSLHPIHSDRLRKNRQLTVLAGDYYVGLYYYLLAEKKQLPMIRVFSQSIQEINEHKMNLMNTDNLSYEEIQNNAAQIESVLLQNMCDYFDEGNWKRVIKDFFYLKRLLGDKAKWFEGKTSPIMSSILKDSDGKGSELKAIEAKIEDVKDRLLANSKALKSFDRFVIEHVDELIKRTSLQEIVAEEG